MADETPAYDAPRSYPPGRYEYHGLPKSGPSQANLPWIMHLYELNIESVGHIICIIATIFMVIFVGSFLGDVLTIFGGITIGAYGQTSWIVTTVFDVLLSIVGVYTAVRGMKAFCHKSDENARTFKCCMVVLFVVYMVTYIIKSIMQFGQAEDLAASWFGFSTFAFVVGLILGLVITALCCGYCYTQATKYQKYLEYYEECRAQSKYQE